MSSVDFKDLAVHAIKDLETGLVHVVVDLEGALIPIATQKLGHVEQWIQTASADGPTAQPGVTHPVLAPSQEPQPDPSPAVGDPGDTEPTG